MHDHAAEWDVVAGRKIWPSRQLDESVASASSCRATHDVCKTSLADDARAYLDRLHQMLETFVVSMSPRAPAHQLFLRASFADGSFSPVLQCVGYCQAHGSHKFTAEFMEYIRVFADGLPARMGIARAKHGPWTVVKVAGNEDWEATWLQAKGVHGEVVALQEVTCKPGRSGFNEVDAIGVRAFDFDRHAAKLQEEKEVKAAVKAVQSLTPKPKVEESFKRRSRKHTCFKNLLPPDKLAKAN